MGEEAKGIDFLSLGLQVAAGLALFLYAVTLMGDTLKELAGDKMRGFLARFTSNPFSGIVTGTVATTLLDSSSVVIIMVLTMVNASLISSIESFGVIMGANIGTTISSQIIAFNIAEYSPILLVAGLILSVIGENETRHKLGKVLFGAGLIFFGLWTMDKAVEPLRDYPPFFEWMKKLDTPVEGALIGGLLTLIIQSSSATVGIAIVLASQQLISLQAGIAIMLGAEIGTCSDTLLAVIGRSKEAIRAGLFHLLFNIASVVIGLLLIQQLIATVEWLSGDAPLGRKIANAHVLFNVLGVVLFAWFIPYFHRSLTSLVR
ncbi:Na/Pi cotransporter family protein [Fibrisoma montanum]|uniref:Na/Pi cotransporter family protein n=1 Tax=Fibrisoma montanum TaxID=2305895 RepID=A0A418LWV1_9BACT|nr:Na/Pi symporter [Fibrisoma montanum]RIV17792.1 Na/Pi cotransporter family protein [Fibrisoma montanum]